MLLTLFFVFLFILLALLTFFRNVIYSLLSAFFSLFHRRNKGQAGQNSSTTAGAQSVHRQKSKKGKVISSDDGEYVDFEELNS